MANLLLLNPRRRRRKAKKAHRRARRKMTAKQLKFFGPRRSRRARRAVTVFANPSRRIRRRRAASVGRRRFRRNPIGVALPSGAAFFRSPSIGGAVRMVQNAAVGATGAVAVDIAMGQAIRFLPPMLASRYGAEGQMQPGYYLTKMALALGLGVIGTKFLPGALKGYAARAAEGSLTVQAYEIARAVIPSELFTLGYYNAARVVGGANALAGNRMRGMRAYLPTNGAKRGGMGRFTPAIGGSAKNFEGYAL